MRSATPRRPKRCRYTPRPAKTPGLRYTALQPQRADLHCYGVAAPGAAGAPGCPLGIAAWSATARRYVTAGAAPWQ
jgi:hypothetical protein